MPEPTKRQKATAELPKLSRIGDDPGLRGLFGGGVEPGQQPAVREVQRPGPVAAGECAHCDGSGFRHEQDASGNRIARECVCRDQARLVAQLRRAQLPDRYLAATFETYRPRHRSQEVALVRVRGLVQEWPMSSDRGVALVGPVGTGKTHLAVAMLRGLVGRGVGARFVNVRRLLDEVKETFKAGGRSEADVLRPVFEAEVLVLDELGAERYTDFTFDMVEKVINTRYDDNRTTSITSNLPMHTAEPIDTGRPFAVASAAAAIRTDTLGDRIGARMVSRLHEMCDVVNVEGEDFRRTGRR